MEWTYGVVINTPQGQPVPLQLSPFTCSSGPVPRIKQPKTPLQVLQLLLTTVTLEKIVRQSILFATLNKENFLFRVEEVYKPS